VFKPWEWSRTSNEGAVANARAATTELSRLRVEREDVELFLAQSRSRRGAARRPA
jgi:hypothetical protein